MTAASSRAGHDHGESTDAAPQDRRPGTRGSATATATRLPNPPANNEARSERRRSEPLPTEGHGRRSCHPAGKRARLVQDCRPQVPSKDDRCPRGSAEAVPQAGTGAGNRRDRRGGTGRAADPAPDPDAGARPCELLRARGFEGLRARRPRAPRPQAVEGVRRTHAASGCPAGPHPQRDRDPQPSRSLRRGRADPQGVGRRAS